MVIEVSLYDEVEMKKAHPCVHHCKKFQLVRLGADVKIMCMGCGNIIMMDRDKFNHSVKKVVASHDGPIVPINEI